MIRHHQNDTKLHKEAVFRGGPDTVVGQTARIVSFTELSSYQMVTVLSYAYTFDRAVSLIERLSSTSRRFLDSGARSVLESVCFRDYDEKTMMECIASIKPLNVLGIKDYRFDIEWPTKGQIKNSLMQIIKEERHKQMKKQEKKDEKAKSNLKKKVERAETEIKPSSHFLDYTQHTRRKSLHMRNLVTELNINQRSIVSKVSSKETDDSGSSRTSKASSPRILSCRSANTKLAQEKQFIVLSTTKKFDNKEVSQFCKGVTEGKLPATGTQNTMFVSTWINRNDLQLEMFDILCRAPNNQTDRFNVQTKKSKKAKEFVSPQTKGLATFLDKF